jgi:hypothetical protein
MNFTLWLPAVSVLGLSSAAFSSTQDFYQGKTVRFIVAFSPDGIVSGLFKLDAQMVAKLTSVLVP